MFVFMGSYSGGDYDSSGDEDSQDEESADDHIQPELDDYTSDDGNDDSSQDSDTGGGSAVGPGGSTGGEGGGGTTAPEGTGQGDSSETEAGEEAEDDEEQQPESSEVEESKTEPEDDIDEPDDTEEDVDEDADERENDDEDEEEDEVLVVVQEVDALSAMSWGVQPVMKHVEECYGEEIELFYKPAPVREFDDTEQVKQKWMEYSEQVDMPVDPSFWDNNPPESTELVNRAFEAAIQQGRGMDYIRAMWRHGIAAGREVSNREVLIDLASDLGLNLERFKEDLDTVELEAGERDELPFTFMEIQGAPVPKNGRVRYSDFKTQFTFQGIEEQDPQELQGFVKEHGPVATPEVMEVYGIQRQEAVQRLEALDSISSFNTRGERFWTL
ncbi:DsbA family protein [Halorussus ruber]|uniref:DsbA family protein n=1 Tax=Halorussus ruber TaxID=1126238 RepID=UPI001B2FE4DA|nr:DsbA family protein [Halorussus ruber]